MIGWACRGGILRIFCIKGAVIISNHKKLLVVCKPCLDSLLSLILSEYQRKRADWWSHTRTWFWYLFAQYLGWRMLQRQRVLKMPLALLRLQRSDRSQPQIAKNSLLLPISLWVERYCHLHCALLYRPTLSLIGNDLALFCFLARICRYCFFGADLGPLSLLLLILWYWNSALPLCIFLILQCQTVLKQQTGSGHLCL